MPDHGAVSVLGDHLESEQPSIDMHQRRADDQLRTNGARTLVREAHPRADRGPAGVERVVYGFAGRGLTPREKSRRRQDG